MASSPSLNVTPVCFNNLQRNIMGPVANKATKGRINRKMKAALDRRIFDYKAMMAGSKDPTGRKGSGGYHKPGSNQR